MNKKCLVSYLCYELIIIIIIIIIIRKVKYWTG